MSVESAHAEIQAAERFTRRRWRAIMLFTVAYAWYAAFWLTQLVGAEWAASARVLGAGLLWAVYGLAVLAWTFGRGGRGWSARQSSVINDELVMANRASGMMVGYAILLAGLFAVTVAMAMGVPRSEDLLHVAPIILITVGIAVPALIVSIKQWRASDESENH
jgi:hypothetical protein